ncbi:hypothetical protein LOK49_LG01G00840 [Camellia lanceoleosa]|uniref:Uncharacterized protein n=1 Tax=Camellia lanceoleosa TaxID=1840588 RepID=A0ACC0IYE5_9ERIC|nr:hypothetical protein LOK49_LG01G00840 [Camellia lanceoleosa]
MAALDSISIELDEDSDERYDNSNLCLVGKILAPKILNKNAVSKIIHSAWKTRVDVSISSWSENVYLFRFGNEEDRDKVLRETPWSVMGNLLVLKPLVMGQAASEIDFSTSPFWVQVHGLPVEKMTRRNGQIIAESIGTLIGVEAPHDGLLLYRSFLHIQVEINVSKPLPRGFILKKKDPTTQELVEKWVHFKFERLSDFCYDCGRIGHDQHSCKFVDRSMGSQSGYGSELRTGVAPNLGLSVEFNQKQIDTMEARLSSSGSHTATPAVSSMNNPSVREIRASMPTVVIPNCTTEDEVRGQPLGSVATAESNPLLHDPGIPRVQPPVHIPLPPSTHTSVANHLTLHKSHCHSSCWRQDLSSPGVSINLPLHPIQPPLHVGPAYFVTEPSESPSSPKSPPSLLSISPSPESDQSPPPSPQPTPTSLPLGPIIPDLVLSKAFNTLSLKRKAQDLDHLQLPNPKLLKPTPEISMASHSLCLNPGSQIPPKKAPRKTTTRRGARP